MTLPLWALLIRLSLAQSEETATQDDPGETVLVMGDRVAVSRARLEQSLRRMGYTRVRQRGDEMVFLRTGKDRWKPRVVLHDEGTLEFREPRVVVLPPVAAGESYASSTGIADTLQTGPDRGDVSLQFPLIFPSKRKQEPIKTRVLETVGPDLSRWQAAIADAGLEQRLAELPTELELLWRDGDDPRSDVVHADAAARKAALLDLWATRSETEAGLAARQAIERFLREVVQGSDTPITADDLMRVNERRGWGEPLAM